MSGAPVCAFCRTRPVDARWRPFCSERCKLQDLARWADGTYRIPGEPLADPDDEHETGDAGHGRQK
jgi:endogenous inhibitor of DNA gyrase (YacG/DUF329 family)